MRKLLQIILFVSLKGCSMSQPIPTDSPSEKKNPTVSIQPVGNPVPLPAIETNANELLQSGVALEHVESTQEKSNKGDEK
jgi:hypothetical protein